MSFRNEDAYLALSRLEASTMALSAQIMSLQNPHAYTSLPSREPNPSHREEHQAGQGQTGEVLEEPSSLYERNILRFPISLGREKGSRPGHSQCLKAFLRETNPILFDVVGEDNELKKTKKRIMKNILSRLYDAARHLVRRLRAEIARDNSIPDNVRWKNIPTTVKQAYYDLFENLARNAGISLDRCVGHWGAHMLLADRFHDTHDPVVKNANGVSQRLNTMLNKTAERTITTTVNSVPADENPSIANFYSVFADENSSIANIVISVSDS